MRSSAVNLILVLSALFYYDALSQETPAPLLSVILQDDDIGNATEQDDPSANNKIKIPPLPSIIGNAYPSPPREEEIVSAMEEVLQPLKPEQPPKKQPGNVVASLPAPIISYTKKNENVVDFTKRIYSSLGTKSIADLAIDFKNDFEVLNEDNNKLGEELNSLYEMRLDDLKRSVLHAKKMRDLLDILESN
jgi:hypothetical protein